MPPSQDDRTEVGFIGTGVMGRSMAQNLLAAGYQLTVYNRTRAKARPVVEAGATWAPSVGAAVAKADFVCTIVGFPADVRQVYLGSEGVLANAPAGAVLIDLTTSEPSLAQQIAAQASERGLVALDAPVSGGDVGARGGTLSIMVGGEPEAFERARDLLEVMGKTVVYQGPAGSGQHTKMCNQIAIASNMIGVMEALLYAQRSGLDPTTVLSSIGAGAAGSWSLSNLYPRVVQGDFDPGFYVQHFLKDIRIALDEAERMGLVLPGLSLARELYERVEALGGAELGTQALYKALAQMQESR
jgi:3-hydroxyisobutyrate dehydrogenase